MSIAKRGLAWAARRGLQSLFNSKPFAVLRPLRLDLKSDPLGAAHDQVEAFTALFFQCRKARQVVDSHDKRRLAAYCRSLGLRLSRTVFVSPYQISLSPDHARTVLELAPRIQEAVRANKDHEYLAAFLQFIDFAYGGKKLQTDGGDFTVIPAGSATVRADGTSYTFSVFDCAVVIVERAGRFVLAHMKIGHAYTPRAEASLAELMNGVRDLDAGGPASVYVIADNASAVGHMISQAFKAEGIHGTLSLHQKSQVHCACVAVGIREGKLEIRMASQIATLLDWPGWSEITAIMPPSPITAEVTFVKSGDI